MTILRSSHRDRLILAGNTHRFTDPMAISSLSLGVVKSFRECSPSGRNSSLRIATVLPTMWNQTTRREV